MISHNTIEQVKDLPAYEVIREYVPDLKKAGSSYRACSPFTDEKTPSFFVVPSKDIFKCFSTGKGGSAITFVMEHKTMSYVEAIKEIAGKFGIAIEYEISEKASKDQSEREELFKINHAASRRFAEELFKLNGTEHPAIAELVAKRKFTPSTIAQWQLGFAPGQVGNGYKPDQWKFLTSVLHEKALIDPALKLGLVTQKDKTCYDTYRNRITFPIHNHQGRIVSFGGRALVPDEFNAKYINGSDSPLFNKSKVLYGLNFADKAIRKLGWTGLVEGYTDVISFHQAGHNNTVGTCGTALTPEQCQLLKKYADKVILFPDPDSAGLNSALRNGALLLQHGLEVALVPMPNVDGKKIDPDELVRMIEVEVEPEVVNL
jgi:DNA primase